MKTKKNGSVQRIGDIARNQFKELISTKPLKETELAGLQGGESSTKTAEKYLRALGTGNGIM